MQHGINVWVEWARAVTYQAEPHKFNVGSGKDALLSIPRQVMATEGVKHPAKAFCRVRQTSPYVPQCRPGTQPHQG